MTTIFSIFFGGGLGAISRYLICLNMTRVVHTNLPFATFLVNVVGSFMIGFLYMFFIDKTNINPALKLALTAGFCGGLTTFSTFSLELFEMVKNYQFLHALGYALFSVLVCFIAVTIGVCFAKIF